MEGITSSTLMKTAAWAYDNAINGVPLIGTVEELANDYLLKNKSNIEAAIDSLIRFQSAKTFCSGFVSNLGGIITLPVSLPAELTSLFYMQLRMAAAIAYMRGYDIKCDQVKTFSIGCLAGNAINDILKDVGIQIGKNIVLSTVKSIPGKILLAINQKIGIKLLTKFGQTGVISFGKAIPLVSAVVGGVFDSTTTYSVGKAAKFVFKCE